MKDLRDFSKDNQNKFMNSPIDILKDMFMEVEVEVAGVEVGVDLTVVVVMIMAIGLSKRLLVKK